MPRPSLLPAAFCAAVWLLPQSAGAAPLDRAAPMRVVRFSVHLPPRDGAELDRLIAAQSDPRSPAYHRFLSVTEFRARYGPAPEIIARAAAVLRAAGFAIGRRTTQALEVSGYAATVERTFATTLAIARDVRGTARIAAAAPLRLPLALSALRAAVTGFEPRVHLHAMSHTVPLNRNGPYGGYAFTDLKEAYDYPSDRVLDGRGATVGVLMASDVLDSDTAAFMNAERYPAIAGKTPPRLERATLFGGGGLFGGDWEEASADVQTAQGSAPGAQVVLYDTPDLSDESTIGAYINAVESNRVDVLSSSFAGCELGYTAAYNYGIDQSYILDIFHDVFRQGNAQGMTFVAASGDFAGFACPSIPYYDLGAPGSFVPSISYPAGDPNVTAVGGTNLQTTAPAHAPHLPALRSAYVSENAFADALVPIDFFGYGLGTSVSGGFWGSGSGASAIWGKPDYQRLVNTGSNRRTIPDVAMQMGGCPFGISRLPCRSGGSYSLYVLGGTRSALIGTSLSAPEFAGLLALKIELGKKRLGNVNPYIYALAAADAALPVQSPLHAFHDGIPGTNGVLTVAAGKRGYNPIVGAGTPYAANFLGLPAVARAGDPQTPSNP